MKRGKRASLAAFIHPKTGPGCRRAPIRYANRQRFLLLLLKNKVEASKINVTYLLEESRRASPPEQIGHKSLVYWPSSNEGTSMPLSFSAWRSSSFACVLSQTLDRGASPGEGTSTPGAAAYALIPLRRMRFAAVRRVQPPTVWCAGNALARSRARHWLERPATAPSNGAAALISPPPLRQYKGIKHSSLPKTAKYYCTPDSESNARSLSACPHRRPAKTACIASACALASSSPRAPLAVRFSHINCSINVYAT